MPLIRLSLLTLRCQNVEASKKFYEAVGLTVSAHSHEGGAKYYSCKLGELQLELYPRRSAAPAEIRLGLVVPQVAPVLIKLKALGTDAVRTLGRPKVRYAVVKDPDGHTIELHS